MNNKDPDTDKRGRGKVDAGKANEWMKRFDDGESVVEIAEKDGYDPRTVKTKIQLAVSEREKRQVRMNALMDAIKNHNSDLSSYAKDIIQSLSPVLPAQIPEHINKDARWDALKKHLPRSTIWTDLENIDKIGVEYSKNMTRILNLSMEQFGDRTSLNLALPSVDIGINKGAIRALQFHLEAVTTGQTGLSEIPYEVVADKTSSYVQRGAFNIAHIPSKKVPVLKKSFDEIIAQMSSLPEYQTHIKLLTDYKKYKQELVWELMHVTLMHMIPGTCKSCPV
jgi:hypothetical protein